MRSPTCSDAFLVYFLVCCTKRRPCTGTVLSLMKDNLAGKNVLFLNWRDRSHPRAGGAEIYCHEIGRRFVAEGANVTMLTARHGGSGRSDTIDGIKVIRRGGQFALYFWAALHLLFRRNRYDAVVDFQNGIPFFSPLFGGPHLATICVIHHVHQKQFDLHFPWPMSTIGKFLEGPASRWAYDMRPVVAVSPSTRTAVRDALHLRGPIHVVPNGSTAVQTKSKTRNSHPSIVCITRLVPHKRIELLLRAMPEALIAYPDLTLDIAGDGTEMASLRKLASNLRLDNAVTFHGFVSEAHKADLLASAWMTVVPSLHEGWGLTVIEANAVGLPSVAFDVPGLADSLVDGLTGWVAPEEALLGETIVKALGILGNPLVAEAWAECCREWASRFSWDSSAHRLSNIVLAEIRRRRRVADEIRTPSDLTVLVELDVWPKAQYPKNLGSFALPTFGLADQGVFAYFCRAVVKKRLVLF